MNPKYREGDYVRYLTSGDPSSLRTNYGVIKKIGRAQSGKFMYFINSRWRMEEQIVEVNRGITQWR